MKYFFEDGRAKELSISTFHLYTSLDNVITIMMLFTKSFCFSAYLHQNISMTSIVTHLYLQ